MNKPFKIAVIGAAGGIGQQAVAIALEQGYRVVAILRTPANLPIRHPSLEIVKADVMEPASYREQLTDVQAVISAIGVKGGLFGDKPTVLYSQGNARLLEALDDGKLRRIFFISASALDISPVLPWYARFAAKYIIQKLLKHMYADLYRMEAIIKASNTDWTIVRPPQLTDGRLTGQYRFMANAFLPNALKISRADAAHFMVHNIFNAQLSQTTVEVAY